MTALDRAPNVNFTLASWRSSTHDVPIDDTSENPVGWRSSTPSRQSLREDSGCRDDPFSRGADPSFGKLVVAFDKGRKAARDLSLVVVRECIAQMVQANGRLKEIRHGAELLELGERDGHLLFPVTVEAFQLAIAILNRVGEARPVRRPQVIEDLTYVARLANGEEAISSLICWTSWSSDHSS